MNKQTVEIYLKDFQYNFCQKKTAIKSVNLFCLQIWPRGSTGTKRSVLRGPKNIPKFGSGLASTYLNFVSLFKANSSLYQQEFKVVFENSTAYYSQRV